MAGALAEVWAGFRWAGRRGHPLCVPVAAGRGVSAGLLSHHLRLPREVGLV